jgi:SAM-dependent methyltransferase
VTRSHASADAAGHETGSPGGVRLSPEQWDHWYQTGRPTVVSHKEALLFYDHVAPRPGMSAVDLACGNGQWTRHLAAWGLNATGLDFSAEALRQATAAGVATLTYAHWDIDGDPIHHSLQPGSADLVTCRYALPYLQYERLLTDIGRWLRPSGTFYALVYVDQPGESRKPDTDPFHRGLTEQELQTLSSGWAFRRTYSPSRRQRAVVLRGYS